MKCHFAGYVGSLIGIFALALLACTEEPPLPPPPPIIDCFPPMLFFDEGSATVKEQDRRYLSRLYLTPGPCNFGPATDPASKLMFCVTGYTDKSEALAMNGQLSLRRAQAVAEFLIELGVPREKIAIIGLGTKQPLVLETDASGREPQNRRLEIRVFVSAVQAGVCGPGARMP